MKKNIKKLIAVGLCTMSIVGTTVMSSQSAMAAPLNTQVSQSAVQDLNSQVSTVYYSNMVKGDGAVSFDIFLPKDVKLTTTNPYVLSDALTQNYDVCLSTGVSYSKDEFSLNVNWSNQGIKFVGDWVINLDGSVFSDGKDRKLVIKVINDLQQVGTPKITTNVDKGVTVKQLKQGFDLEMNLENAKFNTSCFGNYIRLSMINTSGLRIHPVAYCNALQTNKVKMRVQATNGVESWRTHFEFKIEGNASSSKVPITVRIPIIK